MTIREIDEESVPDKFGREYMGAPEVRPSRHLLECGRQEYAEDRPLRNAEAAVMQQRWHAFFWAVLKPVRIVTETIGAAHKAHRDVLDPRGSELIKTRKESA